MNFSSALEKLKDEFEDTLLIKTDKIFLGRVRRGYINDKMLYMSDEMKKFVETACVLRSV